LADRLAEAIAELILTGALSPGDALPTESDLAVQYGVSRAVVRDATHLLAARGLVDVRHGKGVFVTASQQKAFGDALLLSLQRAGATAWDLEEFDQLLFPSVVAHVAMSATDEELAHIRRLATDYLDQFARAAPDDSHRLEYPFAHVLHAIFQASHNEVMRQIGEQLVSLRRPREWMGFDAEQSLEMDRNFLTKILDILDSRDHAAIPERMRRLMRLPQQAIEAMKATPIGDVPRIDVFQHPGS
jgi:GntR family transcriptional repressor for pyruvate dehydrogenase complex